ncbi:hypothetical protein SNEBB_002955 [Seison nebaliae]|nr:hypothetical protein SNEBB_002955 [Seison nebaliae]
MINTKLTEIRPLSTPSYRRQGTAVTTNKYGEIYEGDYYEDFRHGIGKFSWSDNSQSFIGTFFRDVRFGFGLYKNSLYKFECFYKNGNPFGYGIREYKSDKTLDCGWWKGDWLIRLKGSFEPVVNYSDLFKILTAKNRVKEIRKSNVLWNNEDYILHQFTDIYSSDKYIANDVKIKHILRCLSGNQSLKRTMNVIQEHIAQYRTIVEPVCGVKQPTLPINNNTPLIKAIADHVMLFRFPQELMENESDTSLSRSKNSDDTELDAENLEPEYIEILRRTWRNLLSNYYQKDKEDKFGKETKSSLELMNLIWNDNVEEVKKKLNKRTDYVDVSDNNGITPLMLAVGKENIEMINLLLYNGSDINYMTDTGVTPLGIACHLLDNHMEKISPEYSSYYSENNEVEKKDDCEDEDTSKMELSLCESVVGHVSFDDKITKPFSMISADLQSAYIHQLSIAIQKRKIKKTETTEPLYTKALEFQRQKNLTKIIGLLVRKGANAKLVNFPKPPLTIATLVGDDELVQLLLKQQCNVNESIGDECQYSPIHIATLTNSSKAKKILTDLLNGLADPNRRANYNGEYDDYVNLLSVNSTEKLTREGSTALHILAANKNKYAAEMVQILLEHNVDPNLLANGLSSLALAYLTRNEKVIQKLFESKRLNVNEHLGYGLGNIATVVIMTKKYKLNEKISEIEKLRKYGLILRDTFPLTIDEVDKEIYGNVLDYTHMKFQQHEILSGTSYHALSPEMKVELNEWKAITKYLANEFRADFKEQSIERIKSGFHDGSYNSLPPTNKYMLDWDKEVTEKRLELIQSASPHKIPQIYIQSRASSFLTEYNSPKEVEFCYNCGKSASGRKKNFKKCSRCKEVAYCSTICKQKNWKEVHKGECLNLRKLSGDETNRIDQKKTVSIQNKKDTTEKKRETTVKRNIDSHVRESKLKISTNRENISHENRRIIGSGRIANEYLLKQQLKTIAGKESLESLASRIEQKNDGSLYFRTRTNVSLKLFVDKKKKIVCVDMINNPYRIQLPSDTAMRYLNALSNYTWNKNYKGPENYSFE